jgi:hypothetical protein
MDSSGAIVFEDCGQATKIPTKPAQPAGRDERQLTAGSQLFDSLFKEVKKVRISARQSFTRAARETQAAKAETWESECISRYPGFH